ncbi:MAG: 50S ribosomal protein L1 [Anaerolineae bacterium]
MPKHGKKYLEAAKLIERQKYYSPREALELVKKTHYANFDGTVELHLRTGLDPRHADQQIRGVVLLPRGLGKQVRVLVFAEGEAARIAQEAGADYVGTDEYIEKIQNGWLDFDVAVAVPQVMGKVGRLGKILGPRGLMPSPKAGTIVPPEDLPRVLNELRLGRVEYRVDKTANVHVPIGKVSFPVEHLLDNMAAVMDAIVRAKPASAKGQYIRRVTVAGSMGPGVKVDVNEALALKPSL